MREPMGLMLEAAFRDGCVLCTAKIISYLSIQLEDRMRMHLSLDNG